MFESPIRRWLAAGWVLGWVVIAWAMLVPLDGVDVPDRVVHFAVFFVMTAAALSFCLTHRGLLLVTAVSLVLGIALEYAQSLVPWRQFDPLDMGANLGGTLAGYVVAAFVLGFASVQAGRAR